MNKKKIIGYLHSFVAIPLFATSLPIASLMANPAENVSINQENTVMEAYVITAQEAKINKERGEIIDAFLESKDSPLVGYGHKFVEEAEKNDIDWRLVVSIMGRETSYGKHMCKNPKAKNNPFGWGSCKIGFKSIDESIEVVSRKLSGNDENMRYYKKGMTNDQILKIYNPDSIVPGYSKQVINIMKSIDKTDDVA